MLLEGPNPKDPQDAEVAKMMMEDHEYFESVAHDWAVRYAGAPRSRLSPDQVQRKSKEKKEEDLNRCVSLLLAWVPQRDDVLVTGLRMWLGACLVTDGKIFRYQGWNKNMVDRFINMGFELDAVIEAFTYVGIDRNGGEDYEMEEAYMGDITARLLGEQ